MYGNKSFNDIYYLFKSEEEFTDYVKNDIVPRIRFYAKDYIGYSQKGGTLIDHSQRLYGNLTIITNAKLTLFSVNDIVVNVKTNEQWRVETINVDDNNMQKRFRNRPDAWTILGLKN